MPSQVLSRLRWRDRHDEHLNPSQPAATKKIILRPAYTNTEHEALFAMSGLLNTRPAPFSQLPSVSLLILYYFQDVISILFVYHLDLPRSCVHR